MIVEENKEEIDDKPWYERGFVTNSKAFYYIIMPCYEYENKLPEFDKISEVKINMIILKFD